MKKIFKIAVITAAIAASSMSFAARGEAKMCPYAESDLSDSSASVSFVFDDKLNGDYFIGFYGTKDYYGFTPEQPEVTPIDSNTQFNGIGESSDLSAAIYVFNKNPRSPGARVICYVGNDSSGDNRPFSTGHKYLICSPKTANCSLAPGDKKNKKSSRQKRK